MSPKSKKEYTAAIKTRYHQANKTEKHFILDEFCTICGYNRKYNHKTPPNSQNEDEKRNIQSL